MSTGIGVMIQRLGGNGDTIAALEHEWGEHEVQFLVVKTSKGDITAETHNEHNGYYGGFAIQARLESAGQ